MKYQIVLCLGVLSQDKQIAHIAPCEAILASGEKITVPPCLLACDSKESFKILMNSWASKIYDDLATEELKHAVL